VRAVADQLARLDHVAAGGITHPEVAQLAAELCAVAPRGLTRAHFSDDGSTSVEVAVKIAAQYWRQNGRPTRQRFVALSSAYHGDTVGAVSLAGPNEMFAPYAPLMFDVLRPPSPGTGDAGWSRTAEELVRVVRDRADEIAGVVIEPLIQGAAGMRMYPPGVVRAIRDATREVDTFLIADEVFTGYGRTGAMWACDLAGVEPDLVCVAKGFTAGVLPMAATLATERIYDGFRASPAASAPRTLMHGHSFCGHPVGAAVAREVLAIYRDEKILEGVAERAGAIAAAFERIAALPGVVRTRSLGIVGAADLGDGGYHATAGQRVYAAALRRGVYARPLGDTIYVCPPLNIPLGDLTTLLDALADAIAEATAA
jgi:adenosylmethionine-8-amino-7-oxononanoate aminotransferase